MTVPFSHTSPLSKRGRLLSLFTEMKNERSSFIQHWRELAEFIRPRKPRFTYTDVNRGERRSQKIIDCTGTFAARTLASGMQSGITSPARQWFKLSHPDPDINDRPAVKEWLHVVTQRMYVVLTRSNFYNSLIEVYDDLGTFGSAAMSILEDDEKVIHTEPYAIGSYCLGVDHKRKVQLFAREYQLKVWQIVQKYGVTNPDKPDWNNIDWSRISLAVARMWDAKDYEKLVPIVDMIVPNFGIGGTYDGVSMRSADKRYQRCVFEVATDGEKILECSGFDEFPIMAPRWSVTGEDIYATDCPGMTALGDVKMLQHGEKKAMKAIDKMIDPPLTGPTTLKRVRVTTLPSDITYANVREGEMGLRPTYLVNFNLEQLEAKQSQVRQRIERAFFADLWLMISQSEAMQQRADVTAREIEERHEEKFVVLGPVLERLNEDLLDPGIERVFNIMQRRGLFPPPPPELENNDLEVEYLSIMAQAQKMVGLTGIERTASFVGGFAQVNPDALDVFNFDEAVAQYGDMAGIPPNLINPKEEVQATRAARAKAAAAQQQAQTMKDMSQGALNLSKTDTRGDNGLTDLMRGLTKPGAVPDQSAGLNGAMALANG